MSREIDEPKPTDDDLDYLIAENERLARDAYLLPYYKARMEREIVRQVELTAKNEAKDEEIENLKLTVRGLQICINLGSKKETEFTRNFRHLLQTGNGAGSSTYEAVYEFAEQSCSIIDRLNAEKGKLESYREAYGSLHQEVDRLTEQLAKARKKPKPTEFTQLRRANAKLLLATHPRNETTSQPRLNECVLLDAKEVADWIFADCDLIDRLTAENKTKDKRIEELELFLSEKV